MHMTYLQYQLNFHGIKNIRMRNASDCHFSSWRLYDSEMPPAPDILYVMTAEQFLNLQTPAVSVCIPDYPVKWDFPEQNGLYIETDCSKVSFYNLMQQIFTDYEKWELSLAFAESLDPSQLLEFSTPILHIPLTVIDSQFHFVAKNSLYSRKFPGEGLDISELDDLLWSEVFKNCINQRNVFHFFLQSEQKTLLCYNLFQENRFFARLIGSIENESYARTQENLFSRLALAMRGLADREKIFSGIHAKSHEFQATVCRLLSGNRDLDTRVLMQHQWTLDDTYALSIIRCYDRFPLETAELYLQSSLQALFPQACILPWQHDFVCVRNLTKTPEKDFSFREKMSVFLREHVAKAGDSDAFSGQEDFSLYLSQAREALRLGDKYAPHFWHYRFRDFAYNYLLERCTVPYGPWHVAAPALQTLRSHDRQKGGELYHTLNVYLQTGCNVTQSAEQLNIHRTSMIKRLNRIKNLTGLRLEEADTRLYLMLSYKIVELSDCTT